jgi:hypothetical protein
MLRQSADSPDDSPEKPQHDENLDERRRSRLLRHAEQHRVERRGIVAMCCMRVAWSLLFVTMSLLEWMAQWPRDRLAWIRRMSV